MIVTITMNPAVDKSSVVEKLINDEPGWFTSEFNDEYG